MKRLPFRLISFAQGTLSPVEGVGRWLFNLAAVVSLVLCIASVTLWIRSYFVTDLVDRIIAGGDVGTRRPVAMQETTILTARGAIVFQSEYREWRGAFAGAIAGSQPWKRHALKAQSDPPGPYVSRYGTPPTVNIEAAGFSLVIVRDDSQSFVEHATGLVIPLWFVVAGCFMLPCVWLVRWKRRKTKDARHCPACGYDLRATPERCPECGSAPRE